MELIDLTATIRPTNVSPVDNIEIAYSDHKTGAEQIEKALGVPPDLLRREEGWAVEEILRLNTHGSTHVDAPYHYNSVIQGKPSQTIDQLPLEWFFNHGVKLDMTHKQDGDAVTPSDLERALEVAHHTLEPLDIVLIHHGSDKFYGRPDYAEHGCGVTAEATRWLYDRGIRVMGIDCWGWDRPLQMQAREAVERQEEGIFWAAHQVDLQYSQIERLVNLNRLPATGFRVACFPLKIQGASAAPARVVAIREF